MARTHSGLVFASLLSSVLTSALATTSSAEDIATCGQTIEAGDTGVLQTDLDCPADTFFAVAMEPRATLDLNGHTLNTAGALGVFCDGQCLVKGPGTISGAVVGITSETYNSRITVENCTMSNHVAHAIYANSYKGYARLRNVVFENNGTGSFGDSVVGGPRMKAHNVTATGNNAVVFGGKSLWGENVTFDGNRAAVEYGRVHLTDSSITNSTGIAIDSYFGVTLKNTPVTDSGPGGDGVDIRSHLKPRLIGSSCTHSQTCKTTGPGTQCTPQPESWGVCTAD